MASSSKDFPELCYLAFYLSVLVYLSEAECKILEVDFMWTDLWVLEESVMVDLFMLSINTFTWIDKENKELESLVFLKPVLSDL